MTAASLALETLNQRLHVVRHRGSNADARCPAHDDRSASLTFGPGEHGGAVIHCHAGCETKDVLAAVGLSFGDISPEPHIVAIYDYRDEQGELLWQTERWEPKTFRQRGLPPPGRRVLYHSEWLPQAREEGRTVYIVEGEKDAETLAKLGEIAVCGVNGAGSWLDHYANQLDGLDVIVIADADEPGRDHARRVVKSLDGKADQVTLTEPSFGKDVTDMIEAGYGLNTLVMLSTEPTLGVHRADHVREREITWLWPGYFPTGKMIIIEGDPGDGKSVLTIDLAARLSTGSPLPDGQRSPSGPMDVVMISAEDDPEDTIKPRLRIAGADLRRVHMVVEGCIPGTPFDLKRDLPALELFVTENHVGAIFIDPLMAFMPGDVDAYRDAEVRRALHPLTRMGMRTGCSLIVVRHLTKGRTKAISAGGGSIAFIGAARCGFLVGPHPDDERKRALSCVKINVGEKPPTLGYHVRPAPNAPHVPILDWDSAPLQVTAQEILDGNDNDEKDAKTDAREFLHDYLCEHHTGASWQDIARAGKKEGHSEITMRRVRKSVAYQRRDPVDRDGRQRRGVFWFLSPVDGSKPHLSVVPHPEGDDEPEEEVVRQEPTQSTRTTFSQASLFQDVPGPGPCDICDAEPAVPFGSPWFVRRCLAHNPMDYGGSA